MNNLTLRRINVGGMVLSGLTLFGAILWAFPLYWGMVIAFIPE